MRRSSLRAWLLLVSVLFAGLVIGGVALTTYVVVSDGMAVVAHEATVRIARDASQVAKSQATIAKLQAAELGLVGDAREREAEREFLRAVPEMFRGTGLSEGEFAFYDENLQPYWFSDERAVVPGMAAYHSEALERRQPIENTVGREGILAGLFGPASLGVFIVHVPVELPNGKSGVLDVAYFPEQEEAVIDAIRLPMATLAVSAMFIMVVMMQTSMAWVLKLVDDLRHAADAIDTDQLDIHLPVQGEHEIGALANSINQLVARLRRRADAQTRFIADASHELATPVAGIRGYTNILRAWGCEDPEVRDEAVNAIDRESRRMARLTGDLLSLVSNERKLEYRRVEFDLNARCREVLAGAATRFMHKELEIRGPYEGRLMMVGDPDRIEDAIGILVDNACKYTPVGGSVVVETWRRRDATVVEVRDTGVGIPHRDLPYIFDRFYRSDESRSKATGGFGLGLSIAKSILDAAGAHIEVRSVVGEGTAFSIRFPKTRG